MKFGLAFHTTDRAMSPVRLAVHAEARGFFSLYLPEHTHIPTSRRSPFAGGQLPEEYKRTYDPFVALMAAAAATKNLKDSDFKCPTPSIGGHRARCNRAPPS